GPKSIGFYERADRVVFPFADQLEAVLRKRLVVPLPGGGLRRWASQKTQEHGALLRRAQLERFENPRGVLRRQPALAIQQRGQRGCVDSKEACECAQRI